MDPLTMIAFLQQGGAQVPKVQQNTPFGPMETPSAWRQPAWPQAQNTPFGDMPPPAVPAVPQGQAPGKGAMATLTPAALPKTFSEITMAAPPMKYIGANMGPLNEIYNLLGQKQPPDAEIPPLVAPPEYKETDLTPFVDKKKGMGPKDYRKDDATRKQQGFQEALAAAAAAATGADSLGDLALAAGGAFGGQMAEGQREREMEDRAFAEEMRRWDMEMNALDMELAQRNDQIANARTEREHLHAVQQREETIRLLDRAEAKRNKAFEQALARAGVAADMASISTQDARGRQQFAMDQWNFFKPEISEDGTAVNTKELSPDGSTITLKSSPYGMAGQLRGAREFGAIAGPGAERQLMNQLRYDHMSKVAPGFLPGRLFEDTLGKAWGEKAFDPNDAGTSGIFNSGKADNFFDWFNIPKTFGDMFSESPFEKLQKDAMKEVDMMVAAGEIQETEKQLWLRQILAQKLASDPSQQMIENIRRQNDPAINYGLTRGGFQ